MPDSASTLCDGPDALEDLPPSAKLVYLVLEQQGEATTTELSEKTLLPPRTVRYALRVLRNHDLVERRLDYGDARKRPYRPT